MGAKVRVHLDNSPGHRQFAHPFTRRLLRMASSIGGRLGAAALQVARCDASRPGPARRTHGRIALRRELAREATLGR
jgi:hypothetical protein